MTGKRFTVEEMQNWNKRYKLSPDALKVIDTYDGGEYWTVHANEAYNLCIDINRLHEENQELKQEVELLRNGLNTYKDTLPLFLSCEEIMHFNSELFDFEMQQMDFYKKHPNRAKTIIYQAYDHIQL